MKKKLSMLFIGLLAILLIGCGMAKAIKHENPDKKPSTQTEQQKPTPTPSPQVPVVDHSNDMRSFLPGWQKACVTLY